ncbi:probable U3 small nucleolar RNA-associated protein 11 [Oncorhynchus clarkii lewisi]|uniref:probable U3 small nucleolar RNA-associated protein 11 n=1 Tax=Oncorhynchus clarkii lewisi TaxID=490388 RepID=UPI0039B87E17
MVVYSGESAGLSVLNCLQKIEGLKSELHLLDADGKQKNGHAVYVGAKQKVADFDLASHLDTAPELVERVFNWPTLHTPESKTIQGAVEPLSIKKLARQEAPV